VVAQDLVRQILNRDGGHIPLAAAPNTWATKGRPHCRLCRHSL